MTADTLLTLAREVLLLAALVMAPPVGAAAVAGLFIATIQTATQVQEQTVAFAVRAAAVIAALIVAGPWIGAQVGAFTEATLAMIAEVQQ